MLWTQSTLIFRSLKGLQNMISISLLNWYMAEKRLYICCLRWRYTWQRQPKRIYVSNVHSGRPRVFRPRYGTSFWDKESNSIVSNESSDMIRMQNSSFGAEDARAATIILNLCIYKWIPLTKEYKILKIMEPAAVVLQQHRLYMAQPSRLCLKRLISLRNYYDNHVTWPDHHYQKLIGDFLQLSYA